MSSGYYGRGGERLVFAVFMVLTALIISTMQRRIVTLCGATVYTYTAFLVSVAVGAGAGWWLAGGLSGWFRRWWLQVLCSLLLLAGVGWLGQVLIPRLEQEWLKITLNVGRNFSMVIRALLHVVAVWGVLPALSCGVVARILSGKRGGSYLWQRGCLLMLALVVGLLLPGLKSGIATPAYWGRLVQRDSGFALGKPVYRRVTGRHLFTVYDDPDYQLLFAVDGRARLTSSRYRTARIVAALTPLLVRPESRRCMVYGAEAGWYLPIVRRAGVEVVHTGGADYDITRLAVAADEYLTGDIGEGGEIREAKIRRGAEYDIIMLTPEPVWRYGAARLHSVKSLRRCRAALAKRGVVALHLDTRAVSTEYFARVLNNFGKVFKEYQIWCTGANEWVVVGSDSRIRTPLDRIMTLCERRLVIRDMARAGVALPEMLASFLCDRGGIESWLAGVDEIRGCSVAWQATRLAVAESDESFKPWMVEEYRDVKSGWLLPGELDVDDYMVFLEHTERMHQARKSIVEGLGAYYAGKSEEGSEAIQWGAGIAQRDVLLQGVVDSMELEGRRRIAIGDFKGALRCYEGLGSVAPESAPVFFGLGYAMRGSGDMQGAYANFAKAVELAPEQREYRLELAQTGLLVERYDESDRVYRGLLRSEPESAELMFAFAQGLSAKGRPKREFEEAIALAERACRITGWQVDEYVYGLADLYIEAGRVMEGMGLKRRMKDGSLHTLRDK